MARSYLTPLLCILLASAAVSGSLPQVADYAADWEFVIVNSGTTFRSCSLLLNEDEGKLTGEMVWRWGSVWKMTNPGIVAVTDDGALRITSDRWAEPLVFRRFGDAIEGSVRLKDGTTFYLFGTPGSEVADVAGTWDMTMRWPNGDSSRGILKLRDAGGGRLAGEVLDEYGEDRDTLSLTTVEIEGTTLTIVATQTTPSGQKVSLPFTGEVRGDVIEGSVVDPEAGKVPVTGRRRRTWDDPIALLAESGLDGWHPRDSRKSFDWTCENGILTNEAGTVDIVSDRTFKDFRLHLEYMVDEKSNSGVYLRGRYEAQILDDHGKGIESHGNGAVYSRIPQKVNASRPSKTWQTYDITLIGRYVTIVLNGTTIVDNAHLDGITGGALDPYESRPGPLMLQGDHGKVWFRNIQVYPAMP